MAEYVKSFLDEIRHFLQGCEGILIHDGPACLKGNREHAGDWLIWVCPKCENAWGRCNDYAKEK